MVDKKKQKTDAPVAPDEDVAALGVTADRARRPRR